MINIRQKINVSNIVVDLRHTRCSLCWMTLKDEISKSCKSCGAHFVEVVSNHIGLAEDLRKKREQAMKEAKALVEPEDKYPEMVSC